MTTQPFKLHFTDTEQYFFRPPGLLSVTFTDTRQSISGVDPPHHGKLAVIYPQIHDQRLSRVRSAADVFVLVGSLAEAFVCIHLGTAFLSLLFDVLSTSFQLDEKVADLLYRRGPGQPLSSSLARRVRVQLLPLSPLLFVRGVRGHRRLDLFKGPWPLLWGRGEMAERGSDRLGLCLKTAVLSVCSLV